MNVKAKIEALHEEHRLKILPTLSCYLEQRESSHSRLDPKNRLHEHSQKLSSIVPFLMKGHMETREDWYCFFSVEQNVRCYSLLMDGLLLSIFQSYSSTVQFNSNMDFMRCTLKTYEYLQQVAQELDSTALLGSIASFQNRFRKNWNQIQSETLFFDQVKDLLSHGHDFVAPPLFSMQDVVKRDFFKLSSKKFAYDRIYVELFHLNNGTIAVFKVNSQTLPLSSCQQTHELLLRLSKTIEVGYYQDTIFQTGRTLLFPLIRYADLDILSEALCSVLLGTKTGNSVELLLSPVDSSQWTQYWRSAVRILCSEVNPKDIQSDTPLEVSLLDNSKLSDTGYGRNIGLGLSYQNEAPLPAQPVSRLRKSKPFTPEIPSLSHLESMNFKNLLELNSSIDGDDIDISSPLITDVKNVNGVVATEKLSPVIGQQVDDIDSVISDEVKSPTEESPLFNLSSEFHRPQLTKRKSSSFLSIFKKEKGKQPQNDDKSISKGLSIDTDLSNSVSSSRLTSSTSTLTSTPTPTPTSSNKSSAPIFDSKCELPSNIKLDTNAVIFDTRIKVSHWYGSSWKYLSTEWLQLQIVNSNQNLYMFSVQDENANTKICIAINKNWVISRTTAQDIQIRFSPSDFVCSVLNPLPNLLSVRCPQVENLINMLKHAIKNEIIAAPRKGMSTSETQATLESNSSSIMSNSKSNLSFSRSSTTSVDLSYQLSKVQLNNHRDYKLLLLLSKVKVRLHRHDPDYGWKLNKVGLLNIYAKESEGTVIGCKFEVDDFQSFTVAISDLKRIGRTGIALGDQLVEFKKQTVADETYKLLSSL